MLLAEATPAGMGTATYRWTAIGLTVRLVRGRKMPTFPRLYDQIAAALQFPSYFGESLDALDECLADLEWLPTRAGYVVVVTEPADVLSDAGNDALRRFLGVLRFACDEWAQPVAVGAYWDRDPVPFHVVLQVPPGAAGGVATRWCDAGAVVVGLTLGDGARGGQSRDGVT